MPKTLQRTPLLTSTARTAGQAPSYSTILDCRAVDGGEITFTITNNGALGAPCLVRVLIAHNNTSAPTAGPPDATDLGWKQVYQLSGGLLDTTVTRGSFVFGPEKAFILIQFSGNTTAGVTVEAHATTFTY